MGGLLEWVGALLRGLYGQMVGLPSFPRHVSRFPIIIIPTCSIDLPSTRVDVSTTGGCSSLDSDSRLLLLQGRASHQANS